MAKFHTSFQLLYTEKPAPFCYLSPIHTQPKYDLMERTRQVRDTLDKVKSQLNKEKMDLMKERLITIGMDLKQPIYVGQRPISVQTNIRMKNASESSYASAPSLVASKRGSMSTCTEFSSEELDDIEEVAVPPENVYRWEEPTHAPNHMYKIRYVPFEPIQRPHRRRNSPVRYNRTSKRRRSRRRSRDKKQNPVYYHYDFNKNCIVKNEVPVHSSGFGDEKENYVNCLRNLYTYVR